MGETEKSRGREQTEQERMATKQGRAAAEQERMPHRLALDERTELILSGVSDVNRFDEEEAVLVTSRGELTVRGHGLHVQHMDLDAGDLRLCGTVELLAYSDEVPRGGFLRRLFR